MKKVLILVVIFLLVGCSKTEKLNIKALAYFQYDNIILADEQLLDICPLLNNISFSKEKINDNFNNYIYLVTNDKILELFVSNNYNMMLIDNGVRYYSHDVKQVNILINYLQNIKDIYTNDKFYTVKIVDNYVANDNDVYINLNESNYYIVIKSQINIFNFKIVATSNIEEQINDSKELYNNDYVEKNKKIVIRINKPDSLTSYQISFDTPYGYNIVLTPSTVNDTIMFTKIFKQKEVIN